MFIEIELKFDCDVAYREGWRVHTSAVDYYSIDLSNTVGFETEVGVIRTFTVNFNGNNYECKAILTSFNYGWSGNTSITRHTYGFFVPVGYDGVVVSFSNAGNYLDNTSTRADIFDDSCRRMRRVGYGRVTSNGGSAGRHVQRSEY